MWRTGTGAYTARIDTANLVGTLNLSFVGTGDVQAVGGIVVIVTEHPVG